jgi:hypothetical protein
LNLFEKTISMIIPIDIRQALSSDASPKEYACVMDALRDCLVSIHQAFLRRHGSTAKNLTLSRVSDGFAFINMDHVFRSNSDPVDDSLALNALLDCMVSINRTFLRLWQCQSLYECGARYARTQDWRPIPALIKSRKGDCKSLGPARCAELLENGIPAKMVHRWDKRDDGGTDFHILLMVDGKAFEDPSKILGMTPETVAEY